MVLRLRAWTGSAGMARAFDICWKIPGLKNVNLNAHSFYGTGGAPVNPVQRSSPRKKQGPCRLSAARA
ncbi:MAG TPA: hypothetical protein VF254_07030, partial [Gammaproteobacteria bacterium]